MKTFIPKENFASQLIRGPEGRILWQQSYSPYNINLAECLSAMIKCARINNWKDACAFGHQLFISGEEVEKWAWLHLRTHCVEDIGPAEPNSILIISELERSYFQLAAGSERRYLTGFWAIRYLSSCFKDRSNDEHYAKMIIELRENSVILTIPDNAFDFHVTKGKEMKRGMEHFFTDATKLYPKSKSYKENDSLKFLIERAKKFDKNE